MKKLLFSLMAVLFLAACSDDDDNPVMKNYIHLATQSATTLNEDSKDTIHVTVTLAKTLEQPATINFALVGNEDGVLSMDQPSMNFVKGDKVKTLKVYSNKKSVLQVDRVITLMVKDCSDANMQAYGEGIVITVKPDSDIPELSEEQKKLLQIYKDKMDMDISRLMGKLDCKVKITFPIDEVGEEGETVFTKSEIQEFTTTSIFTLSKNATAENVKLKMVDNAMGLTSVVYGILDKEIEIAVNQGPYYPSVLELLNYQRGKEQFDMSLDNIGISESGVNFVGGVVNVYGDSLSGVPFVYDFSAWNRQKEMVENGTMVNVIVKNEEGDEIENFETTMQNLVEEQYVSVNPNNFLVYSDISSDDWGNNLWKKPEAKIDFAKGELTFRFPWDHAYSSDWTIVEVTYTMHPAE